MHKIIYIQGFPRSGTTWLANLLNSHTEIIYRHEPLARIGPRFPDNLLFKITRQGDLNEQERNKAFNCLKQSDPDTDRPPFFRKSYSRIPLAFKTLLWTISMKLPFASKIYRIVFTPRHTSNLTLLIKHRFSR